MGKSQIKRVQYIVYASVLIFLLLEIVRKDKTLLDNMQCTVLLVVLLATFYVKWGWRFNPWEKHPKLHPTYEGVLVSTHDNKTRNLKVYIEQTLLDVRVTLETEESKSNAFIGGFHEELGTPKLTYGYMNNPCAIFRNRSEIHYGMCLLDVSDVANLKGQYFTDRGTMGDIRLNAVSKCMSGHDSSIASSL